MGSSPLDSVYAKLVAQENLDPIVQRGIARYAKTLDNETLLLGLIKRPDAPEDLLSFYTTLTSARARTAYLSRPDRTAGELAAAVAKEKRATVLAAIATAPEASEMLLEAISHDPRRSPALAVLANPNTSPAARQRCVANLIGGYSALSGADQQRVSAALRDSPELHADLARALTDTAVLNQLADSPSTDDQGRDRLVELLVVRPLEAAADGNRPRQWDHRHTRSRALDSAEQLLSLIDLAPEAKTRLRDALSHFASPFPDSQIRSLELLAELEPMGGDEAAPYSRLATARRSTDPVLLEAAAIGLGPNETDRAIARALAANDHTPEPVVARLACLLDIASAREAVLRLRAPAAFALMAAHPGLIKDANIERLGPSKSVASDLARYLSNGNHLLALYNLLSRSLLDADGLGEVSWPAISTRQHGSRDATSKPLADLLVKRLGSNEDRWRSFEVLSQDFTGTLGALLDSIVALVPDESSE